MNTPPLNTNPNSKLTVLVIGDDIRSFLAIVRSLGRKGVNVHVAPFDLSSPALLSKFINNIVSLPRYDFSPETWVAALSDLLKQYEYDLIIPCDERSFIPFIKHRDIFDSTKLAIINNKSFDSYFDKQKTRELASQLGVPVAEGRLLKADDTYETLFSEFGMRFVIKPRRSFSLTNCTVRGKVAIIKNAHDFSAYFTKGLTDQFLVERNFAGVGGGLSVLAKDGKIISCFQHRREREPPTGGGSSYRGSEPVDSDIYNACSKMAEATKLTGVAMFEWKRALEDKKSWILVEVNARFWGSLPLAIAAGVDFPYDLLRLLSGENIQKQNPYTVPIYSRHLSGDFRSQLYYCMSLVSDRKIFGLLKTLSSEVATFLWRLVQNQERFDTFSLDDLRPFYGECSEELRSIGESIVFRFPLLNTLRQKISQARFVKAINNDGKKKRVIFVCLGNICRSPFAEKYFLKLCKDKHLDIEILSCGTLPFSGRQSPQNAQQAANKFGTDLSHHRSQFINQIVFEDSDIIIVFDRITMMAFRSMNRVHQAHYLFDLVGQDEILDPYESSVDGFVRTYEIIICCTEKLMAHIQSKHITQP